MTRRYTRLFAAAAAALVIALSSPSPATAAAAAAPANDEAAKSREAYRKFALITPGDAEAGRRLFDDAQKVACALCHGIDGTRSAKCFAIASAMTVPSPPSAANVPDAPPNCNTIAASTTRSSRARHRPIKSSHPAAFNPNVVGLAC